MEEDVIDKNKFEDLYLQIPIFNTPTLEEIDSMIAEVESWDNTEYSKTEIRWGVRELKKIRKKLYVHDRRY